MKTTLRQLKIMLMHSTKAFFFGKNRSKLFKPKEEVVGYKQRSLATKLKTLSTIKSINRKHSQYSNGYM